MQQRPVKDVEAEVEGGILLKFRYPVKQGERRDKIHEVTVVPTDKFEVSNTGWNSSLLNLEQTAFVKVCAFLEKRRDQVEFLMDGGVLEGNGSAEDEELEAGDIIEMKFK